MSNISPIDYLKQIEALAQKNAASLPALGGGEGLWTGIGFKLQEENLMIDLVDVVEILDPVQGVHVPNVKPWFKGLANVRGNLLPLVDLNHFFFGEPTVLTTSTRVIVFADEGVNLGGVVSSVVGMRYFQRPDMGDVQIGLPDVLKPFVDKGFKGDDEYWNIFDFRKLIESEAFVQIAA